MLIFRARRAWLCESFGLVLALDIALSISICILSIAISRIAGFMSMDYPSPKNWFVLEKMRSPGFEPG